MRQQTLAVAAGFEKHAKQTRRAGFLSQMDGVVPWTELVRLIEPHYLKGGRGRPPVGVERMLRIYFLQQWFDLSAILITLNPLIRPPLTRANLECRIGCLMKRCCEPCALLPCLLKVHVLCPDIGFPDRVLAVLLSPLSTSRMRCP